MKLSLRQKFVLFIKGSVFMRWEKRDGWLGSLKIYAGKCRKHGLYENYLQDYNAELCCPKCREEFVEQVKKIQT